MEEIRIEQKEGHHKERKIAADDGENVQLEGEADDKEKKQITDSAYVNSLSQDKQLPDFCSELSIRIGSFDIEFDDIKLMDAYNKEKKHFRNGEPFVVCMKYHSKVQGLEANFGIGIFRDDGVHVYGTNSLIEHDMFINVKEHGYVKILVQDNCLLPGRYMLDVAVHSKDGEKYDDIRNVTPFEIVARKKDLGICRLDSCWEVDGVKLTKRNYEEENK
jgi:hypothetical protein